MSSVVSHRNPDPLLRGRIRCRSDNASALETHISRTEIYAVVISSIANFVGSVGIPCNIASLFLFQTSVLPIESLVKLFDDLVTL